MSSTTDLLDRLRDLLGETDMPNNTSTTTSNTEQKAMQSGKTEEHGESSSNMIVQMMGLRVIEDSEDHHQLSNELWLDSVINPVPANYTVRRPPAEVTLMTDFIVGQVAPTSWSFTPVIPLSKLPHKFVRSKTDSSAIATAFFDDGKFWRRNWKIFYIWSPSANASTPLYLVTTQQVELLLKDINKAVPRARLSLASLAEKESSLKITFPCEHADLRPRYLGTCSEKIEYNKLSDRCPRQGYKLAAERNLGTVNAPSESQLRGCRLLVDTAQGLEKNQRPKDKDARANAARERERNWGCFLHEAERFLGLRPSKIEENTGWDAVPISWAEQEKIEAAKQALKNLPSIIVTEPPANPFDSNVVFISIDIEWYERDERKVTEIGVSTLDTSDLTGIPPGPNGVNWYSIIRSRHFRIREYAHLINSEFVAGCPADFRFGISEFISFAEIPQTLASCLREPYSAPSGRASTEKADEKRTLVLVGHGFSSDINTMRRIGYDVTNCSTLHKGVPMVDTQKLYRAWKKDNKDEKLGQIVYDLGITPFALHNGGNDAAYTMQAMIATIVASAGT